MRSAVSHVQEIFINLQQYIFLVTISKAPFPQIIAWWYARQLVYTYTASSLSAPICFYRAS